MRPSILKVPILCGISWVLLSCPMCLGIPTNNTSLQLSTHFPTLNDTIEMARLSKLIYAFKKQTVCNATTPNGIPLLPSDLECHLFEHEILQGTQVMVLSNQKLAYSAVVYAGTDNLRTALIDTDIFTKPFGPLDKDGESIWLPGPSRVHSGFDNAVFSNELFDRVSGTMKELLRTFPHHRIFTTGHSMGAANSVLAAVGLAKTFSLSSTETTTTVAAAIPLITSINFGCPRTGNGNFSLEINRIPNVGIWRVVLGRDLVPRLPAKILFFAHAGHTVQLDDTNNSIHGYYLHHGNETLGYEGVPSEWGTVPAWVPGALVSHSMTRYKIFLNHTVGKDHDGLLLRGFVTIPIEQDDNDDVNNGQDDVFTNVDDLYSNPPNDEHFEIEELHGDSEARLRVV